MAAKSSCSFQAIDVQQKRNHEAILYGTVLMRLIAFLTISFRLVLSNIPRYHALRSDVVIFSVLMGFDLLFRILQRNRLQVNAWWGFAELFFIEALTYLDARFYPLELLFLLMSVIDNCFSYSVKVAVLQNATICLIWRPVMDYAFFGAAIIAEGPLSLPLKYVDLVAIVAALFIGAALSIFLDQYNRLVTLHHKESLVNCNLDVLNRTLMGNLYSTQIRAEQKVKNEVTKYVHDNTGYFYTNIIMMLQATEAVYATDAERGNKMLLDCINYACKTSDEIRQFLRAMQRQPINRFDIQKEIFSLVRLFEHCTGVSITITFDDWPEHFSSQIDEFFLSFIKEGLTNAVKHGNADKIYIHCNREADGLIVMNIHDNGTFSNEEIIYGLGLQGISDALDSLGGALEVSRDVSGFTLQAAMYDFKREMD